MGLVGAGLGIGSVGTGNGGCSGGTGTSGGMLGGVSSVLILVIVLVLILILVLVLGAPIKGSLSKKELVVFPRFGGAKTGGLRLAIAYWLFAQRPTLQTPSRASNLARGDQTPLVEHQDRARAKLMKDGW